MLIRVWDIGVRAFHWCFAVSVALALVTGLVLLPTWITLHLVAGTVAAALVVMRVVWGVWGPGPARFGSFVHGPGRLLAHARALSGGTAHRHLGHNPLGGAMIVALLVMVILLAITGVIAQGGALKSGPLAFMTTYATGWSTRSLHQLLAYVLLGMVVLHLGGVVFESRRNRESLVRAMLDGLKEARPGDEAPRPARARPLLAGIVTTALLLAGAVTVYGLSQRPALGVPSAPLDPVYAEECGACHIPYHPSLEPASSWTAMMAGLTRHFGQNAALDPATAGHVLKYLLANSAEHFDTLAANRLRVVDPADPLRITAAPFWKRIHRHIPDSVFKAKPVVSRGNCAACHHDTGTGMYHPSEIELPEVAEQ